MRRVSFPNLPRTHRHPLHPLSPILAPVATGTADGRLGRAHSDHHEWVERKSKDVWASGAHHDFNKVRSGSGEARRDAGHGDVLAAALRPGLEKNGSGWSYGRVELALRGANGCGILDGVGSKSLGMKKLRQRWIWVAQRGRRRWAKKRKARRSHRGITEGNGWARRGLSTSRRARAAKQQRGWARGGACKGGACPPCGRSGRARDPHRITVALPYHLFSVPFPNSAKTWTKAKVSPKWKLCKIL